MTIVEFLLARIDEDEAPAMLARREEHLMRRDDPQLRAERADGYAQVLISSGRVLAECQAKRAIIAEHGGRPPFHVDPCDAHDVDMRTIPCDTLRHLAAVYADHPDYRDEWRP